MDVPLPVTITVIQLAVGFINMLVIYRSQTNGINRLYVSVQILIIPTLNELQHFVDEGKPAMRQILLKKFVGHSRNRWQICRATMTKEEPLSDPLARFMVASKKNNYPKTDQKLAFAYENSSYVSHFYFIIFIKMILHDSKRSFLQNFLKIKKIRGMPTEIIILLYMTCNILGLSLFEMVP